MKRELKKELDEIKLKIKANVPHLAHRDFIVWKSFSDYYIQEYLLNGKRKELFGNVYKVDFTNRELIVSN